MMKPQKYQRFASVIGLASVGIALLALFGCGPSHIAVTLNVPPGATVNQPVTVNAGNRTTVVTPSVTIPEGVVTSAVGAM